MTVRAAIRAGVLALGVGTAMAAPANAAAASRAPGCTAKGATVVARAGTSLLLTASYGPDDDLYGPGMRVMTCRRGHPRVTLVQTGVGDGLTLSHAVFSPGYVAFAFSSTSVACTKYFGDDPQCRTVGVASYNRRTGRRRASGAGPADALVMTTSGWLAWISPPDSAGTRTLTASTATGERVLDRGLIDPASLRASGTTVAWTIAGAAGSADLG